MNELTARLVRQAEDAVRKCTVSEQIDIFREPSEVLSALAEEKLLEEFKDLNNEDYE